MGVLEEGQLGFDVATVEGQDFVQILRYANYICGCR
jgi:hypothetical protein